LESLLDGIGLAVLALDLDHAVGPDVAGALPWLPVRDACADTVMAFQMLEHMPLEMLGQCLNELRRAAKRTVLISLPDQTPFWNPQPTSSRLEALAIAFHHWTWARQTWRFGRTAEIDPEHFWEIGHDNVTPETVIGAALGAGLKLKRTFRNPYFSYHAFFEFERVLV
jgi:hypothetical protein